METLVLLAYLNMISSLQRRLVEEDGDGLDPPLVVDPVVEGVEVEVAEELSEGALLEAGDVPPQLVEIHVHPFQIPALFRHLSQVVGQFQLGLKGRGKHF